MSLHGVEHIYAQEQFYLYLTVILEVEFYCNSKVVYLDSHNVRPIYYSYKQP